MNLDNMLRLETSVL